MPHSLGNRLRFGLVSREAAAAALCHLLKPGRLYCPDRPQEA